MGSHRSRYGLLLAPLVILGVFMGAPSAVGIGTARAAEAGEKAEAAETIPLEIGKAQLVPLSETPDVVMLGDPTIADVVVEEDGLMFLLGREPGETNLLVMNKDGGVILSSAVVVGPLKKRQMTVDRGVEAFTLSCNPRCVPVATPQGTGATVAATAASGDTASGEGEDQAAASGEAAAAGSINPADLAGALSGLLSNLPASK